MAIFPRPASQSPLSETMRCYVFNVMCFFVCSFQKAIKAYGVADVDVFQTIDLWECKDFAQVVTTLFALGREVSKTT